MPSIIHNEVPPVRPLNQYRNDERQVSVAIEFVTNQDRFDSDGNSINNRSQIVNSLVNHMEIASGARPNAATRFRQNNLEEGNFNNQ